MMSSNYSDFQLRPSEGSVWTLLTIPNFQWQRIYLLRIHILDGLTGLTAGVFITSSRWFLSLALTHQSMDDIHWIPLLAAARCPSPFVMPSLCCPQCDSIRVMPQVWVSSLRLFTWFVFFLGGPLSPIVLWSMHDHFHEPLSEWEYKDTVSQPFLVRYSFDPFKPSSLYLMLIVWYDSSILSLPPRRLLSFFYTRYQHISKMKFCASAP